MGRRGPKRREGEREANGRISRKSCSANRMADGIGCIYVMVSDETNICKIGKTVDVHRRLAELQVGSFRPLNVYWACRAATEVIDRLEHAIHYTSPASGYYIRGEWYAIAPDLAVSIITRTADRLECNISAHPQYATFNERDVLDPQEEARKALWHEARPRCLKSSLRCFE